MKIDEQIDRVKQSADHSLKWARKNAENIADMMVKRADEIRKALDQNNVGEVETVIEHAISNINSEAQHFHRYVTDYQEKHFAIARLEELDE